MTIRDLHEKLDKLLLCGANPEIEVLWDGTDETSADVREVAEAEPRAVAGRMCFVLRGR